jgi:cytochrome bd ubiquinol oxidase subunit II
MDKVVAAYLWLAILFYILFGGADFGAGIIEMFTSGKNRRRTRKTLYHAIGPIWEANHMWLIIAIVILFVGFPQIYSEMSIYLHIPLAIMLLGIIARGTAFIFRHYDAFQDHTHRFYNRVFVASSFITPLFLGILAGSAVSGRIDHHATTFAEAYIFGWLNFFSISVGIFTVALCGFLAAIYLIAEAQDENDRQRFIRKARVMNIASFLTGLLVFLAAIIDNVPLLQWIFGNTWGTLAFAMASVSLWVLWVAIRSRLIWVPRIIAGFQVSMILFAVTYAHFPDFIRVKDGANLSLFEHQAPEETMSSLAIALLVGSIFILPALYYLYYSFKSVDPESGRPGSVH